MYPLQSCIFVIQDSDIEELESSTRSTSPHPQAHDANGALQDQDIVNIYCDILIGTRI